ncbi:MAG: flagellar biosynthetic protein FliO [Lachnospiraceae bacterium]|nr:flagellar biosynthetic protein FliO [Lachnospiraceae bacterium]
MFEFIVVLIIFVGVLVLTYYTTRFIANYQKAHTFNKNIEIIETARVANNKYIQVVRVGKEDYFVIGVGKDEIAPIGQVRGEDLDLSTEDVTVPDVTKLSKNFKDFMDSFRNENSNVDK